MRAIVLAVLAVLLLPGIALGHHIATIKVDCTSDVIPTVYIEGRDFIPSRALPDGTEDPRTNSPLRFTYPDGSVNLVTIAGRDWTATFDAPQNGTYTIDWPNSGRNGPVRFTVRCTPTSTPTPSVTPTPTTTPTPRPSSTPTLPSPSIPCEFQLWPGENPACPTASPDRSPQPTLPPTDTETETKVGEPWMLVAAAVLALVVLIVLLRPHQRRRR